MGDTFTGICTYWGTKQCNWGSDRMSPNTINT